MKNFNMHNPSIVFLLFLVILRVKPNLNPARLHVNGGSRKTEPQGNKIKAEGK